MATKANKYGDKRKKVYSMIRKYPHMTQADIAKEVGCHPNYVYKLMSERRSTVSNHSAKPELLLVSSMEVPQAKAKDVQEGGSHYKDMPVQPWDVFDTWPVEQRIGAYRGNCLKYIMRMETKDSRLLNARKLAHYASKLVEVLEEEK